MRIDPNQLYQYLLQNGGTKNEAAMLTGMAGAESNYNPTLSHDGGTGYGLWGHRNERWRAMQQMAGAHNPAWQQQALYALRELHDKSMPTYQSAAAHALAAAMDPTSVTRAGMHFERPVGYTSAHPEAGHNYGGRLALVSQYMGASPAAGSSPATPAAASATTPAAAPGGETPEPPPPPPEDEGGPVAEQMAAAYEPVAGGGEAAGAMTEMAPSMPIDVPVEDAVGEGLRQALSQRWAMKKETREPTPLGELFAVETIGQQPQGVMRNG